MPAAGRAPGLAWLRRVLDTPRSVADMLYAGVLLGLPYVVIGLVWAIAHLETVHAFESSWDQVLPAGAPIAAIGEATALWPALLLLPTTCSPLQSAGPQSGQPRHAAGQPM